MVQLFFLLSFLLSLNASELKETFVKTDETSLFCRHGGEGSPIIVIHGGPGLTQNYLLPYMVKLTETNEVVFYNQRGCGESSGEISSASINISNFMKDLEAVQNAFGFKKVTIIGHSWGGFLAMKFAITHPERVEKLILVTSMAHSRAGHLLCDEAWKTKMAPFIAEINSLSESNAFGEGDPDTHQRFYKLIFATYFHNPQDVSKLDLNMSPSALLNAKAEQKLFKAELADYDLSDELKKIKIPTLIVHGTSDITPPCVAEEMHQLIPNSSYILLTDCGHFPYIEKPEEFYSSITHFINAVK